MVVCHILIFIALGTIVLGAIEYYDPHNKIKK